MHHIILIKACKHVCRKLARKNKSSRTVLHISYSFFHTTVRHRKRSLHQSYIVNMYRNEMHAINH